MTSTMRALVASAALCAVVASCAPPTSSDADDSDSSGSEPTSNAFIDTSDGLQGPADQELTQTDGSTWSFRSDDVTLLYFGYTSCPDVCPTTMADLAVALKSLPKASDDVTVRFVTTDPRRDTLRQLRTWLAGFDPDFIGARAPIGKVVDAAEQYGIGIQPPKVTKGNYEVTHGAQVLVLRPDGRSVGYFREGTTPAQFKQILPEAIEEAESPKHDSASLGEASRGDITISSAWAAATMPTGTNQAPMSAGYAEIANAGSNDEKLVGASSPAADMVQLHETVDVDDSAGTMKPVDQIVVPAGSSVGLHPGGYHLMIMGLHHGLRPGSKLEVDLRFAGGMRIPVEFSVIDRTDRPGAS